MNTRPNRAFHFAAGVVMTTIGVGLTAALLTYKIGAFRVGHALGLVNRPAVVVRVPPDVESDLIRAGAVGENVEGLENPAAHESFMVEADAQRGYRLKPNMAADLTVLPVDGDPNFDPPIVALPAGARLATMTRRYLDEQGRVRFRYTSNSQGLRVTLPAITASDQVLIIGDSVAFGVGVNDGETAASQLQQQLGASTQVINAAVPGYSGFDAIATAEQMSASRRFRALVYLACDNDFVAGDDDARDGGRAWRQRTAAVMERLKGIAGRFDRVVVVLTTPLEYEVRDVLLTAGTKETTLQLLTDLRAALGGLARAAGFAYDEWSRLARASIKQQGTVFAPFALYADHVHLSPAGNGLLAMRVAELVR